MKFQLKNFLYDTRFRIQFKAKIKKTDSVLILQMGKVGSSTISSSLDKQYPGLVIHAHGFNETYYDPKVRHFYRYYQKHKPIPVKIISMVREPIGRNVSAFFQNFKRTTGEEFVQGKYNSDELKSIFLEKFTHQVPLGWMDIFNDIFGIDVYATVFPESGIARYSNDHMIELLIMRNTIPDDMKEQEIKQFLGMHNFQLVRANIGEDKNYGDAYKKFKLEVKLPKEYIEMFQDSLFFNHFFSKEEINEVVNKWSMK